jgi:hypothetical protein
MLRLMALSAKDNGSHVPMILEIVHIRAGVDPDGQWRGPIRIAVRGLAGG